MSIPCMGSAGRVPFRPGPLPHRMHCASGARRGASCGLSADPPGDGPGSSVWRMAASRCMAGQAAAGATACRSSDRQAGSRRPVPSRPPLLSSLLLPLVVPCFHTFPLPARCCSAIRGTRASAAAASGRPSDSDRHTPPRTMGIGAAAGAPGSAPGEPGMGAASRPPRSRAGGGNLRCGDQRLAASAWLSEALPSRARPGPAEPG
jgi:hypothetical protein